MFSMLLLSHADVAVAERAWFGGADGVGAIELAHLRNIVRTHGVA